MNDGGQRKGTEQLEGNKSVLFGLVRGMLDLVTIQFIRSAEALVAGEAAVLLALYGHTELWWGERVC